MWLLCVAVGVIGWWVIRPATRVRMRFWSAARRHPELAAMWMALDERTWQITNTRPGPDWQGPFHVGLGDLGTLQVWSTAEGRLRSQASFLTLLGELTVAEREIAAEALVASARPTQDAFTLSVSAGDLIPARLLGNRNTQPQDSTAPMAQPTSDWQQVGAWLRDARRGHLPLGTAVQRLTPFYQLLVASRRDATAPLRLRCAAWIMENEATSFPTDAPIEARRRLLHAWATEHRSLAHPFVRTRQPSP